MREEVISLKKREEFIQMLAVLVFDKAKKESKRTSINGLATYLRDAINDKIGVKTLERFYKGHILRRKKEKRNPQEYTLDILSQYIDYDDFNDFLGKSKKEKERVKRIIALILLEEKCKKNAMKYRIGILFFAGLFLFMTLKYQEKNCMIWVGNHYEKIKCSGGKLEKSLDQETLEEMKQLNGLCKGSTFFLPNDEPIVWYDKHHNKLTYFTKEGIHPTNGKTLKPISQYIIDKYAEECD